LWFICFVHEKKVQKNEVKNIHIIFNEKQLLAKISYENGYLVKFLKLLDFEYFKLIKLSQV
jgi:hypothetical protein